MVQLQMVMFGDSNSFKYLSSAKQSHIVSHRTTSQNEDVLKNESLYNKLSQFLSSQHISLLKKKLLQFRGTHNPISYKSQFNVQERWEKTTKLTEEVNFNLLMSSNKFYYAMSSFIMIHNFLLIWFLSVFRLYEIYDAFAFFQIGIVFIVGDVLLKIYLYSQHYKTNNEAIKLSKFLLSIQFLTVIIGDLWCIIYYICILAGTQLANVKQNTMLPLDIITIIFLTKRAYQIYNYLVILIVATKYKNQMTIFDLAIKMIVILHFFSMLLYGVAISSPQSNWMTRINLQNDFWDTRYIYTMYFACTTMFTVGYGDILPTNKMQIITIMIIQALGMALFGYIVNEVGAALGNMRKKRANFQKDIYNAQRISSYYQLNSQLGKKVRDYVISNQIAQQQLGIDQENDFLLKLNQQLRNEVKETNQLKIIKTSIFFISHWSKKIQIQLAKKLLKSIFAPNENVHSKGQVDRLYILVKGKIEVYTQKRFGTKICCRKLLKTIQKLPGQEVFNNVFGYTSFFSGKSNRLKVIAKESTVCYTIGYEDVRDSINEDSNDFEYFHELRQKFQLSKNPQKWQTPNIVNIRQSYSPIIFYIIKKHTKLCKTQKRHKSWTRRDYIHKRVCEQNFMKNISQSIYGESYEEDSSSMFGSSQPQNQVEFSVSSKTIDNVNNEYRDPILQRTPHQKTSDVCLHIINNSNQIISNRSYRRKYWFNSRQERYQEKAKQFLQQNAVLTSQFEIGKNYNRFFTKCNKKLVLQKLVNKPELLQFDLINSRNMSKYYQSTMKRTIKRNFTDMFKEQMLQN